MPGLTMKVSNGLDARPHVDTAHLSVKLDFVGLRK